MSKNFRQGAVGALLDEYERAISDLKKVIETLPDAILTTIIDPQTSDDNCRSVQTILSHVVHAGYGYAVSIYRQKGYVIERPGKAFYTTVREYLHDLDNVLAFTENVFKEIKDNELEQYDDTLKILTGWGQRYDIEQLTEHAIVHILRHRRQIEKLTKISDDYFRIRI